MKKIVSATVINCVLTLSLIVSSASLSLGQVYTYSFSQTSDPNYTPLTNATISSAVGDDDAEFGISLPFGFNYGGNLHTEIGISTNGWIRMGSSTLITEGVASDNSVCGTSSGNLNFIFPLWDNLNPEGGSVSYKTLGNAPNRIFVVEWANVHWSDWGSNTAPLVSFQVWLHEGSNIIEFRYGQMNDGSYPQASIGLVGAAYRDFISVTPGNPSSTSTNEPNNQISSASFLSNTVYTFAPAPICTGNPLAEIISASTSMVCSVSGTSVDFSLSGLNVTDGLQYQWEQSPDGLAWSDAIAGIGSGTPFYTSDLISSVTFFRCKITCSASSGTSYSDTFQVQPGIQACYCASAAQDVEYDSDDIGNIQLAGLNNGSSSPTVNNSEANLQRSDFTNIVASPILVKGFTYPISVSQISSGNVINNGHINVFIDYNQNGVYEDNTNEHVFHGETYASLNISTVLGNITIPSGAATGTTGMRVILVTSLGGRPQEASCDQYGFGETEDYLVQLVNPDPCNGIPNGGSANSSALYSCNSQGSESTVDLSLSGGSISTGLTYQWQISNDNVNWTDVSGAISPKYTSSVITDETYFRCKTICQASGSSAFSTSVLIHHSVLGCYCASGSSDSEDNIDIGNVTFGSINNGIATPVLGNPTSTKSYSDFTNLAPAEVFLGGTYPISVSQVELGEDFYSTYVVVYIDFNQDGLFDEGTEQVVMKPTFSSDINMVTSNITIPLDAQVGLTKMRVILYFADTFYATACDIYGTGETEDYLLNITAPPDCQGQPNAGTAVASNLYLCNTTPGNTNLSLSGVSVSSGLGYQWQQSIDGITWVDVNGATSATFTTPSLASTTFFRCGVTCLATSELAYSGNVKVTVSFLGCYCTSYADDREDQDIGNVTLASLNNGDATVSMNNAYSNNTYSDFRNLPPTPLQKGIAIPISITEIEQRDIGSFYASYVNVYIDYNQDGTYDPSTELAFSGSTGSINNVAQGEIIIPYKAVNGVTGMRISLQDGWSRASGYLPCGDYDWGETEDYLVDIVTPSPCSGIPDAGKAVPESAFLCNASANGTTVVLTNFSIASGLEVEWQESSDNSLWNTPTGTINDFIYTTPLLSSSKYYRAKLTCTASGQYSYSSSAKITSSVLGCYCQSAPSDAEGSDIGNVKIGNLLDNGVIPDISDVTQYNLSANNTYSDFTFLAPISLSSGQSYDATITQMDRTYFTSSTISVYIDYNQNGIFDIQSELALSGQTTDVNNPFVTGAINIPSNAKSGLTMMRIVLEDESQDPNTPNLNSPCGIYSYGETEDYHVLIAGVTEVQKGGESLISVYPNPTSGQFNIQLSRIEQSEVVVKIFDQKGEVVNEATYQIDQSAAIELSLKSHPVGLYFVNVVVGNESVTKKVVLVK